MLSVLWFGKKIGLYNLCYCIKKFVLVGFLFIRFFLLMVYYYIVYVYSIGGLCKIEFVKLFMLIWIVFLLLLKCGIILCIER